MENKEKVSICGDTNNFNTNSITDNEVKVNMPAVLNDIAQGMAERYVNTPYQIVLAMLLSKVALMATAGGVRLQEGTKNNIPNLYFNVFASSGCGKDYINDELDRLFFNKFYEWSMLG